MKKILPLLIALIVGVSIYFLGMRNFYKNTYPWESILKQQLEKYYASNDSKDLDPIIDLYKTYSFDEEYLNKIQAKAEEIVNSWYELEKNKYICNVNNINTCILYKKDLKELVNNTIKKILIHEGYDNYTIISYDAKDEIERDFNKEIQKITELENNPSKSRQKDYEQIRLEKCLNVTECSECKKGLCICTYVDPTGSKKETIHCKDDKSVITNY